MVEGSAALWFGASGFEVLDVADDGVELTIAIESTSGPVGCPSCGTRARPKDRRWVTVREALLYFPVFYPELEEVDGHVLLYSEQFESRDELRRRFRGALTALGVSPADQELGELESTFNVLEVEEGFVSEPPSLPTDDDAALALAHAVRAAWHVRLAVAYPDRRFHVEVLDSDDANPLWVVFWEDRHAR